MSSTLIQKKLRPAFCSSVDTIYGYPRCHVTLLHALHLGGNLDAILERIMHVVKRFLRLYLVILPTIAGLGGYPIKCGLCIANNGVANCVDFVAMPCIRILNSGEEEVRDVLVARCDQQIDPSNMKILTTFKGKRCKYYTVL